MSLHCFLRCNQLRLNIIVFCWWSLDEPVGPLFIVCVEVLQPSQPSGVMSSMVPVLCTFFCQKLTPTALLDSAEGRELMTAENISWSNLHERMLPTQLGLNPQSPDHQSDAHPTEPQRPARDFYLYVYGQVLKKLLVGGWNKNKNMKKLGLMKQNNFITKIHVKVQYFSTKFEG